MLSQICMSEIYGIGTWQKYCADMVIAHAHRFWSKNLRSKDRLAIMKPEDPVCD